MLKEEINVTGEKENNRDIFPMRNARTYRNNLTFILRTNVMGYFPITFEQWEVQPEWGIKLLFKNNRSFAIANPLQLSCFLHFITANQNFLLPVNSKLYYFTWLQWDSNQQPLTSLTHTQALANLANCLIVRKRLWVLVPLQRLSDTHREKLQKKFKRKLCNKKKSSLLLMFVDTTIKHV